LISQANKQKISFHNWVHYLWQYRHGTLDVDPVKRIM
jgi:hypothetical protein